MTPPAPGANGRSGGAGRRIRQAWAMVRGLGVVGRYLFRAPVTTTYPDRKPAVQPRFKGRHFLTLFADGMERCVGCELCVIVCPSQSIFVRAAENDPLTPHSRGERYATDFQINMLRCIFCGFCEEACPTGAIVLGHEYELSATNRRDLIYTKDRLTEHYPGESGRDPNREV
ncbi:MAG TPA: NADH-quinone oxidoreductase subunit NuoI [bacterium]|nr:NADH-quinone oxidoreductase subunit NuoI [bacterium]